jgi:pyruvate formate lyase activating enzyme
MLKKTDFVLYDLKIIDGQEHVNFTGQSNGFVLENFGQLCRSTVPYRVRVPLIPGVTDNPENIGAIAGLMRKNGAVCVDVLPYNKMAGGKYPMVGRSYTTAFDGKEERTEYMDIFAAEGIAGTIL